MKLIYHPAAEAELVDAARFYDERVKGMGTEFLDEFAQCIAEILQAPERWRIVRGDKRRFLMPRFPCGLNYRLIGGEVRLLVIKHHRQHPAYGVGRH